MHNGNIAVAGDLSAVLIRGGQASQEFQLGSSSLSLSKLLEKPRGFWRNIYNKLKRARLILASMTFAAFMLFVQSAEALTILPLFGLVTDAGAAYMAADFLSASSARINAFNYHDSGTGTTAAVAADTGLETAAGPTTRATGTQSNPSANVYRSVGTISYTGTLAITEWGLFADATRGSDTMWDHRVFSAINVVNGDSIQFTYNLTINSGGS